MYGIESSLYPIAFDSVDLPNESRDFEKELLLPLESRNVAL